MPTTFIGDVHGWSERLDRVLAQAQGDIVFMGDLIDRGPDAPGVLRRVRALCAAGRARCLMGNHEYALVRSVGCPELGIPPCPPFFSAWARGYGGQAVLRSYGVDPGPDAAARLAQSLGDHVRWMAELPWVLDGVAEGRAWTAVHAGLDRSPWQEQVAALRCAGATMRTTEPLEPSPLYSKRRAFLMPADWPADRCLVSGHTPVEAPLIGPTRILCDTSGGLPDRRLSGVIFPAGLAIAS